MLGLALALLLGFATAAWAEPADDLRACEVRSQALAHQGNLVKQVRDVYEAQLAEARTQLDAARTELMKAKASRVPEK